MRLALDTWHPSPQQTVRPYTVTEECAEPMKALPVAHPLDNADHEKFQGAHALGQLALPLLLLSSEVRLQAERLYHLLVRRRALHVNLVAQDQERDALWEKRERVREGEKENGRAGERAIQSLKVNAAQHNSYTDSLWR